MKLFWQLTEAEQNNALHQCGDTVLEDIINREIEFDPSTEEEADLKDKIEDALEHIKTLEKQEEKTAYLLNDPDIAKAIYDIALEIAKGAYYHDDDEFVVFMSSIAEEDDESEEGLPEINTKQKSNSLN